MVGACARYATGRTATPAPPRKPRPSSNSKHWRALPKQGDRTSPVCHRPRRSPVRRQARYVSEGRLAARLAFKRALSGVDRSHRSQANCRAHTRGCAAAAHDLRPIEEDQTLDSAMEPAAVHAPGRRSVVQLAGAGIRTDAERMKNPETTRRDAACPAQVREDSTGARAKVHAEKPSGRTPV